MKNECDIVKDLIFSYNDGVLSETSKNLVENHLKSCKNCSNVLKEIQQESHKKSEEKEIDAFKGIRKKITKKNIVISISLIFLILIIIFNILVFINYNEVASTMIIYLQDDITDEQLDNIKNTIAQKDEMSEIKYNSKEEELGKVQDWIGEDLKIENNPMKASLEIKTNTKIIPIIVDAIQDMPGIKKVYTYVSHNPYELFIGQILIH